METERHPLTWSAQAATTHVERAHNEQTGRYEPTGRVSATVAVVITVRAFDRLTTLGAALATHEALSVNEVSWHVDWDNPGWPQVRAAAIRAAIRKGRDYAAALGGSLHGVEHIADAGLLGGSGDGAIAFRSTSARMALPPAAIAASRTRHPWTRSRRSCPPPSKPVSPPRAFRCLRRIPRPAAEPAATRAAKRPAAGRRRRAPC